VKGGRPPEKLAGFGELGTDGTEGEVKPSIVASGPAEQTECQ